MRDEASERTNDHQDHCKKWDERTRRWSIIEAESGSDKNRVQCPSLCQKSTLSLGHVPDAP